MNVQVTGAPYRDDSAAHFVRGRANSVGQVKIGKFHDFCIFCDFQLTL